MQPPAPLSLGGQHGAAWVEDFLKGVKSACVAIGGTDDPCIAVEPHCIPDSDVGARCEVSCQVGCCRRDRFSGA
jgi:hypothetical protein